MLKENSPSAVAAFQEGLHLNANNKNEIIQTIGEDCILVTNEYCLWEGQYLSFPINLNARNSLERNSSDWHYPGNIGKSGVTLHCLLDISVTFAIIFVQRIAEPVAQCNLNVETVSIFNRQFSFQ